MCLKHADFLQKQSTDILLLKNQWGAHIYLFKKLHIRQSVQNDTFQLHLKHMLSKRVQF